MTKSKENYKYYLIDDVPVKVKLNENGLKVASYVYSRKRKDFELNNEYLLKLEDHNKILEVANVTEDEFRERLKTLKTLGKIDGLTL